MATESINDEPRIQSTTSTTNASLQNEESDEEEEAIVAPSHAEMKDVFKKLSRYVSATNISSSFYSHFNSMQFEYFYNNQLKSKPIQQKIDSFFKKSGN